MIECTGAPVAAATPGERPSAKRIPSERKIGPQATLCWFVLVAQQVSRQVGPVRGWKKPIHEEQRVAVSVTE